MVKKCLKWVIVLCFIALFYIELPYFFNTLYVRFLFFRGFFVGVFLGYIIAWLYSRNKAIELASKIRIYQSIIYPFAFSGALLAVLSNHIWCEKLPKQTVIFLEQYTSAPSAINYNLPYSIRFRYQGNIFKIHSDYSFFKNLAKGTDIELPIYRGFWGYEFVKF